MQYFPSCAKTTSQESPACPSGPSGADDDVHYHCIVPGFSANPCNELATHCTSPAIVEMCDFFPLDSYSDDVSTVIAIVAHQLLSYQLSYPRYLWSYSRVDPWKKNGRKTLGHRISKYMILHTPLLLDSSRCGVRYATVWPNQFVVLNN